MEFTYLKWLNEEELETIRMALTDEIWNRRYGHHKWNYKQKIVNYSKYILGFIGIGMGLGGLVSVLERMDWFTALELAIGAGVLWLWNMSDKYSQRLERELKAINTELVQRTPKPS